MSQYNIIAQNTENTVVSEYTPLPKRAEAYQSEAQLEKEFIRLLCEVGYTYLPIHTEADLVANLRKQLEKLNNYQFTDGEWSVSSSRISPMPMKVSKRRPAGYRMVIQRRHLSVIRASQKTFASLIKSVFTTIRCRSSTNIPFLRQRALPMITVTM